MKKKVSFLLPTLVLLITLIIVGCAQPAPTPSPSPSPTVSPTPTPTHEIVSLPTWTAPFGTGDYQLSLAIDDLAKKNHPWLRLPFTETPGYIYNMNGHNADPSLWTNTIIGTGPSTLEFARQALQPFFTQAILGYRLLFSWGHLPIWFVTLDPNIKTPQDMIGKRIGMGTRGQITWGVLGDVALKDAWQILDKVEARYLGQLPSIQALLDGTVDAVCVAIYLNMETGYASVGGEIQLLAASGRNVYHIGFSDEDFARLQAAGRVNQIPIPIPVGILPGLDREINGMWAEAGARAAKDVFPEDLAYEYTKFWLQSMPKLQDYVEIGKVTTPKAANLRMTKQNAHPGAVRAFEELGMTIPDR